MPILGCILLYLALGITYATKMVRLGELEGPNAHAPEIFIISRGLVDCPFLDEEKYAFGLLAITWPVWLFFDLLAMTMLIPGAVVRKLTLP